MTAPEPQPDRPPRTLRVAIVELTSTANPEVSLEQAHLRVEAAAAGGAQVVALPEAVPLLGSEGDKARLAQPVDGPWARAFSSWARSHGIHLLVGSIPERPEPPETRVHNTSLWFGPDGALAARYRKIHLFDADVGDGHGYAESRSTAPGDRAVLWDGPVGRWGLTICYDVRFPSLYRDLADAGAQVFAVPSAFTVPTGAAHWEVLLRARAIEHHAFVVAPAQSGDHGGGRKTWGHGMVVDPSGTVLAQTTPHAPVAWATLDLTARERARAALPTHRHRRTYRVDSVAAAGSVGEPGCGSSQVV